MNVGEMDKGMIEATKELLRVGVIDEKVAVLCILGHMASTTAPKDVPSQRSRYKAVAFHALMLNARRTNDSYEVLAEQAGQAAEALLSEEEVPAGICRVCGCTDETPCIDPATGETCSWAEPNLCSACVANMVVDSTEEVDHEVVDD